MFDVAIKTVPAGKPRRRIFSPTVPILALTAAALLVGCAKRDSITVGAIPDDYRTNHPIVIAEKEETLDLAVGATDRGATKDQRATLEGFLSGYDRSAAPTLRILTPAGAANDVAAANAAHDFARIARKAGVPQNRIVVSQYQAGAADVSAPVRISFTAVRAQTNKCGRWPDDIAVNPENKHYANFGCSYQNNVAAQIANPNDLLGPRKETTIDAENRSAIIDEYRKAPPAFDTSIDY